MAVDIVMPRLSDQMEEGTVVRWLVAEGEAVAEGEPLVEVETDKASVTYESEHAGALLKIVTGAGESAAVGAVIAVVGEPTDASEAAHSDPADASEAAQADSADAGSSQADSVDANTAQADSVHADTADAAAESHADAADPPSGADSARLADSHPDPAADHVRPAPDHIRPAAPATGRVKASPVARRIAAELGVDLATLTGSGPHGRIVRADVERSRGRSAAPASAPAPAIAPLAPAPEAAGDGAKGTVAREQLSRLQQTIARRMAESRATVPDFELRADVDMSAAVALREQLRAVCDPVPSYNDFLVRAAALALREFPRVNGAYREGEFERYSRVNVGIAVAAEDALVVATIFDADRRPLREIALAARELSAKVRDGSITPAELAGSTFSVSNLGMFGIDSFSAVVNPPQAAILAAGALKPRPIVDDAGLIVARPTIQLTLACDHRILYGADGARFLTRIRELLEAPLALLAM